MSDLLQVWLLLLLLSCYEAINLQKKKFKSSENIQLANIFEAYLDD